MIKSKKLKALLATVSLSMLLTQPVFAATYNVVPGDSLYKIAVRYNTTVDALKKDNNLNSDWIYPGQALKINPYTYTVQPGDTWYFIGKRFGVSVDSLKSANNKWDDYIYPGQKIVIPSPASTGTQTPAPSSSKYTVISGDSLYLIAKRYGISLYSLRQANNKWDDSIYPGQVLTIPTSSDSTSNPSDGAQSVTSPSRDSMSSGVIPYTASDLDLLARLITAEADGEPYNAKVGVGAVVVNRVKDSRFPKSISSVIYEKTDGYYQFTPVENGWINKPASQDAKRAAYDALHGIDPTNGALFYFDDSATNSWLWSQPIAARIGKIVFTYLR